MSQRPSFSKLVGGVIVLQLVASFAYPVAKYGLVIIEPFTFAFFRFILASVALLTLTHFRKYATPIERKDWPRIVFLGILIIPLNQTLFLLGQSYTAAGHGAILFSTTPLFVFVLAMIHLNEKFIWLRMIGIVLAISGVALVMSGGAIEVGREYLAGDLIILASVVAWAYYTIFGKSLVVKYGALRLTAYSLACGTVIYFPFGLYRALQFDYSQTTIYAWGSVVFMAIGLSLVVYVLWFWLLKYMEASRVAVFHNIQPVIASAVAYFWLAEPLGWRFIIGGSIVLVGVIISELKKQPHRVIR